MRLSIVRGTALVFLAVLVAIPVSAGCGNKRPITVPVRGRITYGGGVWPKPGLIHFTPVKVPEGIPRLPVSAEFSTEGTFSVRTPGYGDGLLPGTYKVHVECWEVEPRLGGMTPAKSFAPEKYTRPETSDLPPVVIEPGAIVPLLRYDIPLR